MDIVSNASNGHRLKIYTTHRKGLYKGGYMKAYKCIENVRNVIGKTICIWHNFQFLIKFSILTSVHRIRTQRFNRQWR